MCVRMSCLLLGIVLIRTTDETYGESKARKFHNITFNYVSTYLYLPLFVLLCLFSFLLCS